MDPMATEVDQRALAQQLLAQAREQSIELVGPDGLLNRLTKNVLETALLRGSCQRAQFALFRFTNLPGAVAH
jgi:hypothetical protein